MAGLAATIGTRIRAAKSRDPAVRSVYQGWAVKQLSARRDVRYRIAPGRTALEIVKNRARKRPRSHFSADKYPPGFYDGRIRRSARSVPRPAGSGSRGRLFPAISARG